MKLFIPCQAGISFQTHFGYMISFYAYFTFAPFPGRKERKGPPSPMHLRMNQQSREKTNEQSNYCQQHTKYHFFVHMSPS